MSGGFGEALAVEIVAEVVLKCVTLGCHIVQNSCLYVHEGQQFQIRLAIQIGIIQAINAKLLDQEIKRRVKGADLFTFYDVMKELHKLFRKYIKRHLRDDRAKTELLKITDADDLFKRLEDKDVLHALSEKERSQSWKFWLRLKDEAAWTVWRKDKNERLVKEIEFWGSKLDQFASWTIPSMFQQATMAAITTHVADATGRLGATNLKSQIMMVRSREPTTAMQLDGNYPTVEEDPFFLDHRRLKFTDQGYSRAPHTCPELSVNDMTSGGAKRSELGGVERRQWAILADAEGNDNAVIVEFKARPGPEDARCSLGMECITSEINKLVKTLRIAGQRPETFRVMYCEGWYEALDHFGLVYRLPSHVNRFRCESLGNILLRQEYKEQLQQDLENRLYLAKALSWTLLEIHSVDWVHQSFHPDNILLFGEEINPGVVRFNWSSPYVVGFDSSRSNSGVSAKLGFKGQWTSRLYTHPDRQLKEYERYKKTYDIYSLGVVLLEVGRLSSFMEDRRNEQWNKASPYQLKEIFAQKAMSLQSVLGRTYREVVLDCLNGQFDDSDEYVLLGEFRRHVCEKLDQIKIS
jgi:hypothetical protein